MSIFMKKMRLWLAAISVLAGICYAPISLAENADVLNGDACRANFSASNGTLQVPCADVLTADGTVASSYQVELGLLPETDPMQFIIRQVVELTAMQDMESACRATYTIDDGSFYIPCVNAELADGIRFYSVTLQVPNGDLSQPMWLMDTTQYSHRQLRSTAQIANRFMYPVAGLPGDSNCPSDTYNPYEAPRQAGIPRTWYSVVWGGKYNGTWNYRCKGSGAHPGVDIRVPSGTVVKAVANGTVYKSYDSSSWGGVVVIKHILSNGEIVWSIDAHLKRRDVASGSVVTIGQSIGLSGGGLSDPNHGTSTGAHLHFQIDRGNTFSTPYWPAGGVNVVDTNLSSKTYDPLKFVQARLNVAPVPSTPSTVSVSPTSGTWTSSPQYVNVSSSNASQIYYTIRTTTDGSTPPDPPEPSATLKDGTISGSSGTFQVYATAGQIKKLKVRFRGYNSSGYGATTGSFLYVIDLRSNNSNLLIAPNSLIASQSLYSNNGCFQLVFQGDGNLVLYNKSFRPLWATYTHNKGGQFVTLQGDGNLVIYSAAGPLWASNTVNKGGTRLLVQDDGNVVLYTNDYRPVWATNTNGAACRENNLLATLERLTPSQSPSKYSNNGCFQLVFQGDGNLVLYNKSFRPLWATYTHNKGGQFVTLQGDGNLVIYSAAGPLWASNTVNKGGTRLLVQDDGNVVLYTNDYRPVWATNTNGASCQ